MSDKIIRGNILKSLRENKKLRQSDLATILDISQQAYQRYENGTSEPNGDGLSKLADFYGVTTDYLLGREQGEPSAVEKLAGEFNMTALEREILEGYVKLPKEMRGDLMEFLHKAVSNVMNESSHDTVTCGELEDRQKVEAEAKDSAG